MNAVELLPIIREAFSERSSWISYPPERLAVSLVVWHYVREVPDAFEVEAALEALDIEREVA